MKLRTLNTPSSSEPLLPQIPLKLLIGLVTVSAVMMGVVQQAFMHQQMWSVLLTVVIASMLLPLLIYAGSFAIASLFATVGQVAIGHRPERDVHQPTATMPEDVKS